ncbi:YesN/AraC family two-component response regulator [Anaerobacterium chartisolvens]|uniref:Stage 0 sporulation protein A homolog n=1 Tax=Anaerobacterium chartisolvens TaxID=1297424 RepID=A0A369B333_9FIRM|nr:response regulator [Anaerobacterium chartisolvens]RCX16030.1 YesN/AraC family two-component response regulator [Anaerobacterium chartisolvens]
MYRILIVDDEYLIRNGLRYAISWRDIGFKVASEAASAEEALYKLENIHVDVVIADIKMPGMNGLDLISIIRKRFPHIKTVIISGFDDFSYSVTAMKMEVHDYILKPINKNTVISTFTALKQKLDDEHQRQGIQQARENAANKLFFQRLLNNDFLNKEEYLEFVDRHGITYPLGECCVIAIRIKQLALMVKEQFNGSRNRLEEALDDNLKKVNRKLGLEQSKSFSVINGDNYSVLATEDIAEELSLQLKEAMSGLAISFDIGIGQPTDDLNYISVSFLQAIEAINENASDKPLYKFTSDTAKKEMDVSRKFYLSKLVIQKIEEGKYEELDSLVATIFEEFEGSDLNIVFNWCVNSIYSIFDYFSLNSFSNKKNFNDFDITVISSDFSINAIKDAYKQKLNKVKEMMNSLHASSAELVVKKACEIANAEYMDAELSLQGIASRLDISYGYLSSVFKQITGENFSVYFTNIRMNHARRLILEGEYKIYEIADRVGYTSARYFTDQFRKQFGVSPSDYRARF